MSVNLDGLNSRQREAAETIYGPVLVLSGAGTGKTRTITYRIAHMLEEGISPRSILAVTFTNKAAKEMAERVRQVAGPAARGMQVSTFHSLGLRIVRENTDYFGLPKAFNIYDQKDQLAVVRKGVRQLLLPEKKLRPEKILWQMQACRNGSKDPRLGVTPKSPDPDENWAVRHVFPYYVETLRKCGAVDFEDLLYLPLQILRDNREVLESYRERFRFILVDEYQDTNMTQFEIVRLLSQESRNLCVVGDDDQSIYGWRGAEIRNILDFEKTFPEAKVIRLEENYRSTQTILDAANCVIRNNSNRKAKRLWTSGGRGEKIRVYAAPDEDLEAQMLCDSMLKLHMDGVSYGDMAILMRMNTQTMRFEESLRRNQIPYVMKGALSFLDRKEMRDFMSYLKVMVNPLDEEALMRVVNIPPRKIGESSLQKLSAFAGEHRWDLYTALAHIGDCQELKAPARAALEDFYALLDRYRTLLKPGRYARAMRDLWDELDYEEEIRELEPDEIAERMANVSALLDAMRSYEEQNPGSTLAEYVQELHLEEEDEDGDDEEDKARRDRHKAKMMTVHSSKGLEFPHVFLVGCEDGVLPHERSVEEGSLEEERRLFYVAVTRAKVDLYISYAVNHRRRGEEIVSEPSRFIREIDEDLLEWHDPENEGPASEESSEAFFARMRAMFEES